MPKNISQASIDFLQKALTVNFEKRMSPEELNQFMINFDKNSSNSKLLASINAHRSSDVQVSEKQESSLTKNTVTTPKNLRRFTFLKNNDDKKNLSLPKTASTLHEPHQPSLLSPPPASIDKKLMSK